MKQTNKNNKLGLVLQGGGARGAYQVGVLKAIAQIYEKTINPFPIISGVSVGAVNASALVTNAEDIQNAVAKLEKMWRNIKTKNIFDPSPKAMLTIAGRFVYSCFFKLPIHKRGWFNNNPMRELLKKQFNRDAVNEMKQKGAIDGFCVTSSCYKRGVAISHFESQSQKQRWQRARREGEPTEISVDHIMASAALPCIFPAVAMEDSFHGDGAMRLTEPLSPAIRLGANKLLAIGTRDAEIKPKGENKIEYPSGADMIGYAFDILFNDNLDADIERLNRINNLLNSMTKEQKDKCNYENINILVLQPSKDLCEIALKYENRMPICLRYILKILSAGASDGRLSSYMLFEPEFINELINLGYDDTIKKNKEIKMFLK